MTSITDSITKRNTIYLHIGAGKTGTTSIQTAIPLVRTQLFENGIYAPLDRTQPKELEHRPRVASGYAFTLARLLNPGYRRNTPFDEAEGWAWLRQELAIANQGNKCILFSSEALQFARERQLQRFQALAAKHNFTTVIIYYVRTAIDYSISEYLQHLKTGFTAYPFKSCPDSLDKFIDSATVPFEKTIKSYSSIFGPQSLIVQNFDSAKKELLNNFFTTVASRRIEVQMSKPRNRSLVPAEQRAFEHLLKLADGRSICSFIGPRIISQPPPSLPGYRYYVSTAAQQNFASTNSSIVEYVNKFLPANDKISISTDASPVTDTETYQRSVEIECFSRIIEYLYQTMQDSTQTK